MVSQKERDGYYKGKVVLVTGGAGSIGRHIVKSLLPRGPKVVRVLDNNETGLFDLEQELRNPRLRTFVGDVRDKERLRRAIEGVDVVFHAAALKHVELCEFNPFEAVKTNVLGTQNLIEVCIDEEVEKFVAISTDKAVSPANVMGATKLLAEKLTLSANLFKGRRKTALCCVRFGNVLGSRGSIVPIFKEQVLRDREIMITDKRMTRFIMTIPRAAELVLKAGEIAKGGELFILKTPTVKVVDLADCIVEEICSKHGIDQREVKVRYIGMRPGEKLYEELITEMESNCVSVVGDLIVVQPYETGGKAANRKIVISSKEGPFLSKDKIREILRGNDEIGLR